MKIFRLFVLTAILLTIRSFVFSQIGINTIVPDSSASLHIVSKPSGSGLLIPRLTEAQRLNIFKPAIGLMVFDLTANLFYMNMDTVIGDNWYAINPWLSKGNSSTAKVMYTSSIVTKVGIGTPTPTAKLDVVGSIKSSTSVNTDTVSANRLKVTGFPMNSLVPAGAIIMWSGTSAPAGWALCDGGGGRPDLRGRFVVGFDASSAVSPAIAATDGASVNYGTPGNTGGEIGHVLSKSELPKHNHVVGNATDGSTLSNPGDHSHSSQTRTVNSGSGAGGVWAQGWTDGLTYSDGAGNHIHTGITGDGTTDGLNSQPHENRPPYYVLAYIIKLP